MMRKLDAEVASEIRTYPFAVFTFIGKDEFPVSFPVKFDFNDRERRITMRRPKGVSIELRPDAPSCVLFHSFNETGGDQRYVMFLGVARISVDKIEFKIDKGPFTRPPDYRESSNQDYFRERAEKYLNEIRPKMMKS
jgi:hypothetical protein